MLCEELNRRKKKLGMTTEQLSQLSGVPVGTINKILSGETKSPRYDTLRALENVLYGLNGESPELYSRITEKDIRALNVMTPDALREAAGPYCTKRQGEYTVEDYRALPEDVRAELIDGVLIFLEAPTFTHQELVTELLLEFGNFVRKNKGTCRVVPSPLDVQLDCDDRTMVQPDIAVICRKEHITRKGVYGAPDLCIEVISESTRKLDYGVKMNKYMEAGVREYWIVDLKREKVVCYGFEGEDAPEINIYTFKDRVPVRIWEERLEVDFAAVSERLWKEPAEK